MYCVRILLGLLVGIAEVIPGFGIVRMQAQRVPIGINGVIVFFQLGIRNAELMPCIAIIRLMPYRLAISINRLVISLKVRRSGSDAEPGCRAIRLALELLLGQL